VGVMVVMVVIIRRRGVMTMVTEYYLLLLAAGLHTEIWSGRTTIGAVVDGTIAMLLASIRTKRVMSIVLMVLLPFSQPMAWSTTVLTWGLLEYWDAYEKSGELANMLDSIR
jgi:hypothetical protein